MTVIDGNFGEFFGAIAVRRNTRISGCADRRW